MFTSKDVADYYNQTLIHYQQWWKLDKHYSQHYGIWDASTKNFASSLENTNKILLEHSGIKEGDTVLDAGCGVGGAAVFIHQQAQANVVGISLSSKQLEVANQLIVEKKLGSSIQFHQMDYTQTSFPDAHFNVIWACESSSSATNKLDFFKEAFRLLKSGGSIILSDFFQTSSLPPDPKNYLKKWADTWGINAFESVETYQNLANQLGFEMLIEKDFTNAIRPSAMRMYYASIIGAIPSELYNLRNPKVSRFAKKHYQTGYFQYKALKNNLWKYYILRFKKP